MLGLGRNTALDKPGGLPQFLAESHGDTSKGRNLLFQGQVEEPSNSYAKLKVSMSPVSPSSSSVPTIVIAPSAAIPWEMLIR